jgi:hypothetical protein
MKPAKVSIALLVVQLAIVASVAAQYWYQRATCPHVWVRAVAPEPQQAVRGRYARLQLVVDGCQSTLPSAKSAEFPRDFAGAATQGKFGLRAGSMFRADLKVENNRLTAINVVADESGRKGQYIAAETGKPCDQMLLWNPVEIYAGSRAGEVSQLSTGQEFWMEVTVPPSGPPRPLQLAVKDNGAWRPLALQ